MKAKLKEKQKTAKKFDKAPFWVKNKVDEGGRSYNYGKPILVNEVLDGSSVQF